MKPIRIITSLIVLAFAATTCVIATFGGEREKGWFGSIAEQPGDENFQRVYVKNATLYHEDGREVALWGVNFQSAMSWEWERSQRYSRVKRYDREAWRKIVDRGFDEIQLIGCNVIRIHLCPDDLADGQGNLVETQWLDMLDYTMAECFKRGIYINFALLNHLGGGNDTDAILNHRLKEHKWEAMVVPEKITATENYIRQLVNRPNPYDNDRLYKHNPAWIIAEVMNEPMWPRGELERDTFPDGVQVYDAWLTANGKTDRSDVWKEFKYLHIKAYINRIDQLLHDEHVPAAPCWNLFWSHGPFHEGWESYDAAADSSVPIVSFSTYPGQSESSQGADLSSRNYLPYLEKSYNDRQWQGWLREERFKGRKTSIVYEYETWHNQSTYMYPAMAKYFRAQGAQVATMWTYFLYEEGNYPGRSQSHDLNLVSTPRKAAGFVVAKHIFENTPRYEPYRTTREASDRFGNAALSFPLDLSAYADDELLVHTGDVTEDFIPLPTSPKRIIGFGSSPLVQYNGHGMYFLQAIFENGEFSGRWTLKVMPHAEFTDSEQTRGRRSFGGVKISPDRSVPITLRIPNVNQRDWQVYRLDDDQRIPIETTAPEITFDAKPGRYELLKK